MIPQLDNKIEPSLFLWLDHLLLKKGQGFSNYTGNFIPSSGDINGYKYYASSHRQWVYDSSINGAIIPSGYYNNGTLVNSGVNKILDFNHGALLSNTNINGNISGSYSYKDVNLYFTEKPEEQVLFDKRYEVNPRHSPTYLDYNATDKVFPLIFIKYSAGENTTLSLDGLAATRPTARLIVLCDSRFLYRAVCGLIRDTKETFIAIFEPSELPFDQFGSLRTIPYNYETARNLVTSNDQKRLAYIKDVSISDFPERITSIFSYNLFGGFVDLELELLRNPKEVVY